MSKIGKGLILLILVVTGVVLGFKTGQAAELEFNRVVTSMRKGVVYAVPKGCCAKITAFATAPGSTLFLQVKKQNEIRLSYSTAWRSAEGLTEYRPNDLPPFWIEEGISVWTENYVLLSVIEFSIKGKSKVEAVKQKTKEGQKDVTKNKALTEELVK